MNETSVDTRKLNTLYAKYIKRFLDFSLSLIALIILLPVLLVIAVLEYIFHGSPIIYNTRRPGKDQKIFNLYKFRSMTNETDANGKLLPESERLTRFGYIIRRTSLDELPELINILKGDMSIIGPRPLLVEYLDLYNSRHIQRHLIRPGLALVRINPGESNTWTWRDQFENDIWYIENLSFSTDIKMLFAIIRKVFEKNDVRANDTRIPFDGNNLDETRGKNEIDAGMNNE